ncbi:DUF805 domain-containing protein [Naasia aerilata]|uniref:DUF805 domain-containing protein n=1 Tax=Naasia aerilata TaxID=1162966 RepID=A0ABM8GEH2_9MICO|nr:DUF805 domain-containing protein [Naasia aerilata]BDZ46695.1 hypothetical protein GCM10025866_26040 [Naasia aerilata]
MTFGQSIQTVFRKYAEFTGRAGRSEFWWWILFTALVSAALNTIPFVGTAPVEIGTYSVGGSGLTGLWNLAVLLPTLAVTVRRLRDAGFGWGHVFWVLVPIGGLVVLAVLCAQPSRWGVATAEPRGPQVTEEWRPS